MQLTPAMEKIRAKLAEVRSLYEQDQSNETLNCLICGDIGTGKTRILSTCRKPVLLHNFDPGGPKVLRKWIEKGEILVTNFTQEKHEQPVQFNRWKQELQQLNQIGAFEQIGTYALDSFTPWQDAMMHEIVRQQRNLAAGSSKKAPRSGWIPAIQDYYLWMSWYQDAIRDIAALPCDFVMTAHLMNDKDELTGEITTDVMAYNKSRVAVPAIFDEVYVLQAQAMATEVKYQMLTRNLGRYKAKTRIGAGIFSTYEEPDIKALLKKAKWPCEDVPSLLSE